MTDRERGQASPPGRGHLARCRGEDGRVTVEEDHEGQLRGRQVEGRQGGTPERRGTEPQKNRRKKTMDKGKRMNKMIEAKE